MQSKFPISPLLKLPSHSLHKPSHPTSSPIFREGHAPRPVESPRPFWGTIFTVTPISIHLVWSYTLGKESLLLHPDNNQGFCNTKYFFLLKKNHSLSVRKHAIFQFWFLTILLIALLKYNTCFIIQPIISEHELFQKQNCNVNNNHKIYSHMFYATLF